MHRFTSIVVGLVVAATACVPPSAGTTTAGGAASASRDPSDLRTAEAILNEVKARQWDGESRHVITPDLAKERAAIDQTKADLAAIQPTFETKVWNEPEAGAKAGLRAQWRAERSYVGGADAHLALLEAQAAAEASPTEANLATLTAAIRRAEGSVWRGDEHTKIDAFFKPVVEAAASASKAWLASTPSLESQDRRSAAVAAEILVKPGVTNTQVTITDERVGGVFVLAAEQMTTVKIRLVDPAQKRGYELVDCPENATDADKCPKIERINGSAEVAVQDKRELRIRGPKGPIYAQVIANEARYPVSALVVGAPPDNASIAERDAERWGLHYQVMPSALSWRGALDLFTRLPKSFVVYARTDIKVMSKSSAGASRIATGEPVLLVGQTLVRANGDQLNVDFTSAERDLIRKSGKHMFAGIVTTERPQQITLPPAWHESGPSFHVTEHLSDADVSEFRGVNDKRVTAYLTARKPVVACIDAERRKHGSGSGYDLVTYDAKGRVQSVKPLSRVLNQRVTAKCKVNGLVAKREALRKALRNETLQAIRKHLAE